MPKTLLLLIFLLLGGTLYSQSTPKVLIIGIDGCRPDALQVATTPNLDQLIANGLYSPNALNDDITISGPGWSAILCGVWSDKHGVQGNNFSNSNYEDYPSIFKHAKDFDANLHTLSICHWGPINDFIIGDYADFKLNVSSDAEVSSQAAAYLRANDPDLVFLQFDEIDGVGHSQGFSPEVPAYVEAIEEVDEYIGPVLEALRQRPNYAAEDWLILVTTDHGGLGTSHGGTSIQEEEVLFIVSGDNIPNQLILRDSMVRLDQAENCLMDTVALRFDGEDDVVQIPADSLFNFGADQDFTIECRVRTSVSGDFAIVGNKDWDSGGNPGFVISFKFPNGPEWKVNIGDGANRADINTGGLIADNEWHTLSVSFDRDGMMKMYEDGQFIAETDISEVGDINTDGGLYFGGDINSAFNYMGSLAEVRVWTTLLDEATIADWYCQRIDSTHDAVDHLIGYWPLNEGQGNLAADLSNNPVPKPGMINGASWTFPDSIVTYDYSQTPRITDIALTALQHLCIPIDPAFPFDGQPWVDECQTTSLTAVAQRPLSIFPNPANRHIQFSLPSGTAIHAMSYRIINIEGRVLRSQSLPVNQEINITDLNSGLYYLQIFDPLNPGAPYFARFLKM